MEEQNKNITTYIGVALILVLLFFWYRYSANQPQPEPQQDQPAATTEQQQPNTNTATAPVNSTPAPTDSNAIREQAGKFGPFASAALGAEQTETIENDLVKITFSNKGGRIKEVLLKKYSKANTDTTGNDIISPLLLLEDEKNRFDYIMAVNGASQPVHTQDLYFTGQKNGQSITYKVSTPDGGSFAQTYTLSPDNYKIDYSIAVNGLQSTLANNNLRLEVDNYLDKLERNQQYERTMSSVYYKPSDKNSDYCDCRKDDQQALGEQPVEWFSHSNQFFNTALVAQGFAFRNFTGATHMKTDLDADLKLLQTSAEIPMANLAGSSANMLMYVGPNEFDRLRAFGVHLEDVIPFGSSIFGTINRWIIHPMFDFLLWLIGSPGICIIMLTLVVKLLVYPLTYKMVHGQAKMAALKPQLEALRKKHGDDQQQMSMESMKLYNEFGVNPLGGCLPMLLQMPIWFALYRFFPAAIEFRQASFLWAVDLSSYDVITRLPFQLPGFGNHISLFTIIWVVTTLWYTWYSMKQMDPANLQNNEQMKVMKYMQYGMPVMFMFFFNSFASGLTCYLCFSNLLNVGQTVFTKRFLIDNEKIKAQLEANRNKPKKTSGFRARLEQAMKEQQRMQEEQSKKKK